MDYKENLIEEVEYRMFRNYLRQTDLSEEKVGELEKIIESKRMIIELNKEAKRYQEEYQE